MNPIYSLAAAQWSDPRLANEGRTWGTRPVSHRDLEDLCRTLIGGLAQEKLDDKLWIAERGRIRVYLASKTLHDWAKLFEPRGTVPVSSGKEVYDRVRRAREVAVAKASQDHQQGANHGAARDPSRAGCSIRGPIDL